MENELKINSVYLIELKDGYAYFGQIKMIIDDIIFLGGEFMIFNDVNFNKNMIKTYKEYPKPNAYTSKSRETNYEYARRIGFVDLFH